MGSEIKVTKRTGDREPRFRKITQSSILCM